MGTIGSLLCPFLCPLSHFDAHKTIYHRSPYSYDRDEALETQRAYVICP